MAQILTYDKIEDEEIYKPRRLKILVVQAISDTDITFHKSNYVCGTDNLLEHDVDFFSIRVEEEEEDKDILQDIIISAVTSDVLILFSSSLVQLKIASEKIQGNFPGGKFAFYYFQDEFLIDIESFQTNNIRLIYLNNSRDFSFRNVSNRKTIHGQVIKVLFYDYRESQTKLECQSWFQYVLRSLIQCDVRNLVTYKETFLVSLLYGLFLADGCSLLLKEIYNRNFLRVLVQSEEQNNLQMLLFQLLYGVFNKTRDEAALVTDVELLQRIEEKFLSADSNKILYDILGLLGIDFIICEQNQIWKTPQGSLTYTDDILIAKPTNQFVLKKFAVINGDNYVLQFASICIKDQDNLVGLVCDDKQVIFIPSTKDVISFPWLDLADSQGIIDSAAMDVNMRKTLSIQTDESFTIQIKFFAYIQGRKYIELKQKREKLINYENQLRTLLQRITTLLQEGSSYDLDYPIINPDVSIDEESPLPPSFDLPPLKVNAEVSKDLQEKLDKPTTKQLHILVIQIVNSDFERSFVFSKKYCDLEESIYHKIEFYVQKYNEFSEPLQSKITKCDVLVLYSLSGENVSLWFQNYLSLPKLVMYVFLDNQDKDDIEIQENLRSLSFSDEAKEKTKVILLTTSYGFHSGKVLHSEKFDNFRVLKYIRDEENDKLTCQSWFKYLLGKFSSCSGYLLQISGTCYMNAILNGFFLTQGCRLLLKEAFNRFPTKFLKELKDFSSETCPYGKQITSQKYILKLIYHFLCKEEKLKLSDTYKQDLFKQASGSFFSSHNDPSKKEEFGQGGSSYKFFISIADALDISWKFIHDLDYYESKTPLPKLPKDTELLYVNEIQKKISKKITIDNNNYILQFGDITLEFEGGEKHAVVGLLCNNVPVIFDSNGYLDFCNWLNAEGTEIYEIFEKGYSSKIKSIEISPVYLREKKLNKLLKNPPVCNVAGEDVETIDF